MVDGFELGVDLRVGVAIEGSGEVGAEGAHGAEFVGEPEVDGEPDGERVGGVGFADVRVLGEIGLGVFESGFQRLHGGVDGGGVERVGGGTVLDFPVGDAGSLHGLAGVPVEVAAALLFDSVELMLDEGGFGLEDGGAKLAAVLEEAGEEGGDGGVELLELGGVVVQIGLLVEVRVHLGTEGLESAERGGGVFGRVVEAGLGGTVRDGLVETVFALLVELAVLLVGLDLEGDEDAAGDVGNEEGSGWGWGAGEFVDLLVVGGGEFLEVRQGAVEAGDDGIDFLLEVRIAGGEIGEVASGGGAAGEEGVLAACNGKKQGGNKGECEPGTWKKRGAESHQGSSGELEAGGRAGVAARKLNS
jgi:hypothetical protein